MAGLNLYFVQRLICRTHLFHALWRPVLAAALTGAVIYPLRGHSIVLASLLAVGVYGLALVLTRTFSADEIAQAKAFLRRAGRRGPGPARAPEREPAQPLEHMDFEE